MLASVSIASLLWAVGLALMLAQTFIAVGLIVSLISAAGILWVYAGDLRTALITHRLNAHKTKEIVLALALFIGVTVISVLVFIHTFTAEITEMVSSIAEISVSALPTQSTSVGRYYFPIQLLNVGKLSAFRHVGVFADLVTSRMLNNEEVDKEFDKRVSKPLARLVAAVDDHYIEGEGELEPDHPVTLTNPNGFHPAQQFAEIISKTLFVYSFYSIRYTDERSKENGIYYQTSYCAVYNATVSRMAYCNRHNVHKQLQR